MPASAEEVMSGSEEEDAGAPPMMHEDDDCNYFEQLAGARAAPAVPDVVLSAFVHPVPEQIR